MSPTALTLKLLRDCGHIADVVERVHRRRPAQTRLRRVRRRARLPPCRSRRAGCPGNDRGHMGDRLARIRQLGSVATWLAAGNRAKIWGWWQTPAGRWDVAKIVVHGNDVTPVVLDRPRQRRKGKGERQRDLFA